MISGPLRFPNVHESGSDARVAVHAPVDMRGSAIVCHASGDGLRSTGHDGEASASRRPSWTRVPVAPSGIGAQPAAAGVVVLVVGVPVAGRDGGVAPVAAGFALEVVLEVVVGVGSGATT